MSAETNETFRLRFGSADDAAALAVFAARTFSDTFAAANRPEDIAAYLPSAYSPERQRDELKDPNIATLIIEDCSDRTLMAYAMLRRGDVPECVGDSAAMELWRFYVDRPWHGSGIARQLMSATRECAARSGARTLWLGVWEKNPRAIAFYEKCGFRDVGAHEFWVGSDRQTDRIMVSALSES